MRIDREMTLWEKNDVSETYLTPDQNIGKHKTTLLSYAESSNKKLLGAPCWVGMTQQVSPSFEQKKWHKYKKRNDPEEKKGPKKDSYVPLRQKWSYWMGRQKLPPDLWGKKLRINTKMKHLWKKIQVPMTHFETRPKCLQAQDRARNLRRTLEPKNVGSSLLSWKDPTRISQFWSKSKVMKTCKKWLNFKIEN